MLYKINCNPFGGPLTLSGLWTDSYRWVRLGALEAFATRTFLVPLLVYEGPGDVLAAAAGFHVPWVLSLEVCHPSTVAE